MSAPSSTLLLREARLSEYAEIGRIAADTYRPTKLEEFMHPYRYAHPQHHARCYIHRALANLLNPRFLVLVVVEASRPNVPIGYTQAYRYGDDESAKNMVAARWSIWYWMLGWMWWAWCLLVGWVVGGDKSTDPERMKVAEGAFKATGLKFWSSEQYKSRWHVRSCVVRAEYQGRGAGKLLMRKVQRRAEEDGVVIGLEASIAGEWMYRSVGFELRSRFDKEFQVDLVGEPADKGGIMLWTPKSLKVNKKTI